MLHGYYDLPLVVISVLVAMLASYTALSLADRVSRSHGTTARLWIAGGAFAMGTGIWAMHFVGMLAFRLPIPLGFDLGITLLSWLLPIGVSALALWRLGSAEPSAAQLARAALLLGAGINAMHYVGMAALRMAPPIVYDPLLVAASIAIAVSAAGAALWIAYRLRRSASPRVWLYRGGAAVVMGFAIAGMHYTGMAAASFPLGSVCRAAAGHFTLTQLAALVVLGTVAVLAIALLTAVYDARLEDRTHVLALSQQAAAERQQLLEKERALRHEAERLSALKDEFLATLSHELRTPLNAVLGWTQILRTRRDEQLVRKGVETIERNARLQARLIDDLLDMSRIVSGRVRIEPELVDLVKVVQAAVEAARPVALARQIELVTEFAVGCPRVWADPHRLEQVLWNLLSNAAKFTPQGGRISVQAGCDATQAEVRVVDSGIGISPEFLPHVFERFRQADASTTRRQGGLGLGLAIARQLVELHGGTITAASEGEGRGASFTVRLPLAAAAVPPADPREGGAARAAHEHARPPTGALAALHVLVVDDEPDARELLEQMLRDDGARVTTAESAEAALAWVQREAFDVIVSDIGMPGIDGFELIRRVRSLPDPRRAGLAAVALTAFTRAEDEARALRDGFDAFLRKPVDAALLAGTLAQLAEGSGRGAATQP
jgi:signal transduction histidine kinase/ActR/RegA family two-component response regulator